MPKTQRSTPSFWDNARGIMKYVAKGRKLWDKARFILADVPLDTREVRRILPCGMWPQKPATATLFIANYPKTSFTVPYREAAVLIHVRTPLGKGIHCPWMIVDDDTALIYGRELLGFPKKTGQFTFKEAANRVTASVSRRGTQVLKMEADRGQAEDHPDPVLDMKIFNAGGPGQAFIIQPIWLGRPKEHILMSRPARVKVTLKESEYDPIARIVSGPPSNGRFVIMDILGSRYNVPVGITGIRWFVNTFSMRFR